jgi:ligand-binding sensor domain-containing protein/serine phosphatase RsbU (regulator of sigma subunit)
MSTQGGLSKFDGKSFTNYTSKEGLPGSDILCTVEDNENNLWIGTNGFGIAFFNGSKFETYDSTNGFVNDPVYSIFKDSKNRLWFASEGGLFQYENVSGKKVEKKFKHFGVKNGLPGGLAFYSICEDKNGIIWFGSKDHGVIKYDGKTFKSLPSSSALANATIFSIYCDKGGMVWAGTPGKGLWHEKNNDFVLVNDERIATEFISAIREDDHHNMWIATDNQLVKINGSKKQYFTIDNGLTSSTIYSLGFDNDGKLWVGTINGLNIFINEAFTGFTDKNGLTNNNTTIFCHDQDGDLLIGTAGSGLFSYNNADIKQIEIPILNNTHIISLHRSAQNEFFIGLNNSEEGIIVLKKKKGRFEVDRQIKKLGGNSFSTGSGFAELPNGEIIAATYGNGLWKLNADGTQTELSDNPLFQNKDIMTIFLDSKNNLWISLNQAGIIKYDFKTFKKFTTKEGLGDNSVLSICEDQTGNIIFGNYENGITIYNGTSFKTFNKENNLCSNNIQSVASDKNGNLWVGTNNGLNKIKINNQLNISSIKLYNESNGLLGTEINQNSIYADRSGVLWIGSNQGLTRYNPYFDYRNTTPPSVVLTGIKLNFLEPKWKQMGVEIDSKTQLPVNPKLSHTDNHLTFYFQALTSDQIQFSYMLEGLDDKWTPLKEKNEADFTNIPPGEYIFKVKALNSDKVWSKNELSFQFTITPPFWQTWWFRITAAIIIIGLVILIIRRRTAKLAKEKAVLEHKVAVRTSELSIANSHLSVALHDIKDSINYAQKIQQSILPNDNDFALIMNDAFVLFKPKDIVSGDFYWLTENGEHAIYATCDCTGHGVPGGFMTMLGTSFLNEIVNEQRIIEPGKVLDMMREKIIDALKQTGTEGENKDGMDMVICMVNKRTNTLNYAAANNSFYIIRDNTILEMKADKQPIGYFINQKAFKSNTFELQKGDVVYTFTDGYADQFGGPNGKKFKYKQLEELLMTIHKQPMLDQKTQLDSAIENWMKEFEQVDDILLIGYRVN